MRSGLYALSAANLFQLAIKGTDGYFKVINKLVGVHLCMRSLQVGGCDELGSFRLHSELVDDLSAVGCSACQTVEGCCNRFTCCAVHPVSGLSDAQLYMYNCRLPSTRM